MRAQEDRGIRVDLHLWWTARWTVAVLVGLAAFAVFTNQWGWYVADARFEHFWGADDFLAAHRHAWDGVRSLGTPAPYFSPVVGAFLAGLDALGASPALAQRVLHGTYLVVAGVGMVQVLRLFRPRWGAEHVLAAVVYAFNPFSAQFLLPSGLFLHYAIAPWLVVATARGLRDDDGWRWSAVFALAVFTVGALNGAALGYALVPSVVTALSVVAVERSASWRRLLGWGARTALLVAGVAAAALFQVAMNAASVTENLTSTEVPATISRTSSWSESWRGLGFWLTYFPTSTGLLRPNAAAFFSRPEVVAATFLLPLGAVLSAWRYRWRGRLLLLALLGSALVLMVGVHPVGDAPPLGRLLDEGFEESLFLRGFRTGYKAGAGWALGVAGLVAVGVVAAVRGARPRWRPVVAGVAVATVGLASFPFWTGRLYPEGDRTEGVPAYWRQAIAWLDDHPGEGRVLVLPGSNRTRYRWGYVGDDIFDALLDRPHAVRSSLSQGTAESADLLVALDEWATSPAYEAGTLAPAARRLGVRWVVVRNDLDWQRTGLPRPSDLARLRGDDDLLRVATFGEPGQHTAGADDATAALFGERSLPPVEVYEVRGARTPGRVAHSSETLLLSGGGDGMLQAGGEGLLDGDAAVRATGSLSRGELRALLSGSPLLVTDTNRRRATQVTSERNARSHTLAEGETLRRSPSDLFGRRGSQSVATFGAARLVSATASGDGLRPFPPSSRPGAAVDGDRATAWQVGGLHAPLGQRLRVELRRPAVVPAVTVVPATGDATVTEVAVVLPDGRRLPAPVQAGRRTRVPVGGDPVRALEVELTGVEGEAGALVGLAEVAVPGLDLAERIRVPVDVALAAAADQGVHQALAEADVGYSFRRLAGEEARLRRAFVTVHERRYTVTGTLRLHPETSDGALARLLGGTLRATSTSRVGGVANRALNVVDGRLDTAWEARADTGSTLTVRFPRRRVEFVDVITVVDLGAGHRWSRVENVAVRVGRSPVARVTPLPSLRRCEPASPPGVCAQRHRIPLPPRRASSLSVELGRLTRLPGTFGPRPVRVAEVRPGSVAAQPASLPTRCVPLLAVDGDPVEVLLHDDAAALLAGRPVPFRSCRPLTLAPGTHSLDSLARSHAVVDRVLLASGDLRPGAPRRAVGSVDVRERTPTRMRFTVHAPQGGVFIPGEAFHEGWRASANGEDLGAPRPVDTLAGWALPPGTFDVRVEYGPQRSYEVALAVSAFTVVLCAWLALRGRRS